MVRLRPEADSGGFVALPQPDGDDASGDEENADDASGGEGVDGAVEEAEMVDDDGGEQLAGDHGGEVVGGSHFGNEVDGHGDKEGTAEAAEPTPPGCSGEA